MKNALFLFFFFLGMTFLAIAQPEKINYQGTVRNASGKAISSTQIRLRLSILDSTLTGIVLYSETHVTTTNSGGQFNIFIGGGTPVSQSFASIPWSNGRDKFLKLELDAQGGTNFQPFGTAPLLSVPYALHAQSANEVREGALIRGNNGETYQISIGSNGPVWNCNPPVTTAVAGADQLNLPGIVFNLTGNQPGTSNSGTWSVLSGTGGVLETSSSYNSAFIRGTDSMYSLLWKMQSACGTSRDTATLHFAALTENQGCLGINTLAYLGNNYPIVRIGNQCWMAKNLDVGSMLVGSSNPSNNAVIEKFCYNDQLSNCSTYGGMYQWAEAVQYQNGASSTSSPSTSFAGSKIQGICPSGWHIPSVEDWCTMVNYYDATRSCGTTGTSFSYVGGALKSLSNWNSPNGGATNRSGFSAVSNGYRYPQGTFLGLGNDAGFWTSSNSNGEAVYFWLDYQLSSIGIDNGNKITGNAIRCLKDTLCNPTTSSAGADQLSLTGTTATLAANAPAAGETGTWAITIGSGATLSNANSPTATFTKGTDSAYTLVWTIAGPCGTSRDTVNFSFQSLVLTNSCPGVASVTYAGEIYPTVQIGTQCWMAKNLNVGTMIQSTTAIDSQIDNGIIEKYCYNNIPSNCAIYGGLYQWAEAIQYDSVSPVSKGICPTGWHIPHVNERNILAAYMDPSIDVQCNSCWSGNGGGLKSTSNLWNSPNWCATNLSGFSALPAGKNNIGYFYGIADFTMFWSSSTNNNPQSLVSNADIFGLHTSQCSKLKSYNRKDDGLSVRCIKDTCSGTAANAGLDQLNISGTTTNLNGNNPPLGESVEWSVIKGIGGVFSQKYSPSTNFIRGNNDTAYTLVYKITGICGTSRDTIHLRFPAVIGNNCGQAVFYGNESYPTVNIGGQCWMSKNLNIGTMISSGTFSNNNGVIEKYCYNNDVNNCSIYGGLYDWAEMAQYQNGVTTSTPANPPITGNLRGICPSGWKIPSDQDFCFLTTYLDNSVDCNANGNSGNDGGGKMKSVSSYWNSPNVGVTNSSAFSALPGGGYFPPSFGNKNVSAQIWTATEGIGRVLNNSSSGVYRLTYGKSFGYSVRCIKECYPTTSSAGTDQLSLHGSTATLAANTPAAGETGTWTITTGSGASLSNANSPSARFTLGTDSSYTLVWTITGPCGTSKDTVNLRFPSYVYTVCGQAVTYAGESYPTIQIGTQFGTQCWFQKNLNVGTMINGTTDQTNNNTLEKYCLNNDPANCTTYGGLYQWAEAVQYQDGANISTSLTTPFTGNVSGICPTGWHLPGAAEWSALTSLMGVSSVAGGALKSTSGLWNSPNTGATNSSGFSVLPGGYRGTGGILTPPGYFANFWTSDELSSSYSASYYLNYNSSVINQDTSGKNFGFSARCIKD